MNRFKLIAPYLALVGVTLAVFAQTLTFQFINYDDPLYVGVLSRTHFSSFSDAVHWAFTYTQSGDWQPLTWLSWMLDKFFYGENASGYHATNLLLHIAVVCLFYFFLFKATRYAGRSFLAAAFFAIHPMRVESVAWVAERKDLLSAFWMMLTLALYVHYVQSFRKPKEVRKSFILYFFILLAYGLGLLSKPMLVTLPVLMLFLDIWPLGRLQELNKNNAFKRVVQIIFEKTPMFVMALGSSLLTIQAIKEIKPFLPPAPVEMPLRVENAIFGYWYYLKKLFWPQPLTFFYPRPDEFPATLIFFSALLLIALTFFALASLKKRPYFSVGWFWYLIVIVPVSGIVHMASASTADRYSYFAHMGVLIALVWLISEILLPLYKKFKLLLFFGVVFMIFVSGVSASIYCAQWKNSKTLYEHAIQVSDNNYRAFNNLGILLMDRRQLEEAEGLFKKALKAEPYFGKGYRNLGFVQFKMERWEDAYKNLSQAAQMLPDDVLTHKTLGVLEENRKQTMRAIAHYEISLKFDTDPNPEIYYKLGNLYRKREDYDESIKYFQKLFDYLPDHVSGHNNAAGVYLLSGNRDKALEHYKRALELEPDHVNANKMIKMFEEK